MTSFVIIIISVNFQLKQLSAKFLPLTISYSCCSIPLWSILPVTWTALWDLHIYTNIWNSAAETRVFQIILQDTLFISINTIGFAVINSKIILLIMHCTYVPSAAQVERHSEFPLNDKISQYIHPILYHRWFLKWLQLLQF